MRSVSYVQRVALEFSGSLFPHAICLGDVDNDTVGACALRETRPVRAGRGGAGSEASPGRAAWAPRMRGGWGFGEAFVNSCSARKLWLRSSGSLSWYSLRGVDN